MLTAYYKCNLYFLQICQKCFFTRQSWPKLTLRIFSHLTLHPFWNTIVDHLKYPWFKNIKQFHIKSKRKGIAISTFRMNRGFCAFFFVDGVGGGGVGIRNCVNQQQQQQQNTTEVNLNMAGINYIKLSKVLTETQSFPVC